MRWIIIGGLSYCSVDQVFVAVGGVAVDQLAQEPCQEELHAEDDQQHREVEEMEYGEKTENHGK